MFALAASSRLAFRHHVAASLFTGLRCAVIRLLHVIAAVSLGAGVLDLSILLCANALGLMASYVVARHMPTSQLRLYILVPAILSNLALLLLYGVDQVSVFVACASLHMFLDACTLPAMGAIQRSIYPREQRGRIIGHVRMLFMCCGLIGALSIAELLVHVPQVHHYVLPAAGVLGLIATIHLWCMCAHAKQSEEYNSEQSSSTFIKSAAASPMQDKIFMSFLALVSMAEIAHMMLQPLLPAYLMSFGVETRSLAWFFVIIPGIAGVCTFRYWGRVIDRIGVQRTRGLGALLYACEPFILAVIPQLSQMTGLEPVCFVWMAAVLRGLGLGAVVLTWSVAPMNFSNKHNCAAYVGCNNFITGLRVCLAPIIGVGLFYCCPVPIILLLAAAFLSTAAIALCLNEMPESEPGVKSMQAKQLVHE